MSDAPDAVKRAYDAVNAAWTAVSAAQEAMEDAGFPKRVVAMLDETRLKCSDTSAFQSVVEIIDWAEEGRR